MMDNKWSLTGLVSIIWGYSWFDAGQNMINSGLSTYLESLFSPQNELSMSSSLSMPMNRSIHFHSTSLLLYIHLDLFLAPPSSLSILCSNLPSLLHASLSLLFFVQLLPCALLQSIDYYRKLVIGANSPAQPNYMLLLLTVMSFSSLGQCPD